MSNSDTASRERASLESFLKPETPEIGKLTLRPFSGATRAMMEQTHNEWLRRVPRAQMENASFATLAWMYIQGAPENEVRRTIWSETLFRESVLAWASEDINGEPRISAEELALAEVEIESALGLIAAAQIEVMEKPADPDLPPAKAPEPPPNS